MTELAIALLVVAVLLFIAEAHAPTTVLGLLGVAALVGAGFAWRDAGHDLPVAAIVVAGVILAGFVVFASRKATRRAPRRAGAHRVGGAGRLDRPRCASRSIPRARSSSTAPSGGRGRSTGAGSA